MAYLPYAGRSHYHIIGSDSTIPNVSSNTANPVRNWIVHRGRLYGIRDCTSGWHYSAELIRKDKHGDYATTGLTASRALDNGYPSICIVAGAGARLVLCGDHYAGVVVIQNKIHVIRVDIDRGSIEISDPVVPAVYLCGRWQADLHAAWDAIRERLHIFAMCYIDGNRVLIDTADANSRMRVPILSVRDVSINAVVCDGIAYISQSGGINIDVYDIASGMRIPSNLPINVRSAGGSLVTYTRKNGDMLEFVVNDLRTGDEYVIDTHTERQLSDYMPWTIVSAG